MVRFLGTHAQRDTRPWWQEYTNLDHDDGELSRICVWGEDGSLSVIRTRLRYVVREAEARRALVKCRRTQQPNGRIRFDLWILTDHVKTKAWVEAFDEGKRRYGWFHRPHVPYLDRVGQGISDAARRMRDQVRALQDQDSVETAGEGNQEVRPGAPLRIGTLNINGVNKKRTELSYLLRQENFSVFGLQETRQRAAHWPLRIGGYKSFVSLGEEVSSTRGLAMLVKNKYLSEAVGRASPFWLFVRVSGGDLVSPLIVGTVYVPPRNERRRIFQHLPTVLGEIREEHPDLPIMMMGDFNMELHELQLEMSTWPVALVAMDNEGSKPTRPGDRARQVDHFVYRGIFATDQLRVPRVLEHWDIADHYPVALELRDFRTVAPQARQDVANRTSRKRILVDRDKQPLVATSNRWSVLATEFEDEVAGEALDSPEQSDRAAEVLEDLAGRWEDACHEVASEAALHQPPRRNNQVRISRRVQIAIAKRQREHRRVQRLGAEHGFAHATTVAAKIRYDEVCKTTKSVLRRDKRKHWYRQISKSLYWMTSKPKSFWNWAKIRGGWRDADSSGGILPIYHEEGHLLTEVQDIAARWNRHFQGLFEDATGHSRDMDYWESMSQGGDDIDSTSLNAPIGNDEIWDALRSAKNHKAPGPDGIPMDFIKTALLEKEATDAAARRDRTVPPTVMTDCIRTLLNLTFQTGSIPTQWESSALIPIPKKGDLADPNNYRGISLMATILKVLTIIISARLNTHGETKDLFSVAQAGFRRREECVTQAACLIEILQRRKIVGERTFATFIDFKKAYDMVPHGALFAKLSRFGVRGRCLNFIKGLYASSTVTIKLGFGETAVYSDICRLLRGLRQG